MKKKIISIALGCLLTMLSAAQELSNVFRLMDDVVFYDGYATLVNEPTPEGIYRLRNDLIVTKISDDVLNAIGNTLELKVVLTALCDNYDRIGSVNLALVPAGSETYAHDEVDRIEIGRFITPFMNKNVQPDTVPYIFNISNVAQLLKETTITDTYDFWIELEVFGVPYAAHTQVAGCSGRSDVFMGTVEFWTNEPSGVQSDNVLLPLAFRSNFNNYQADATDAIGQTIKTISFELDEPLTDAALLLVTSNHGANQGGEEYNRRQHYVYFDDELVLQYRPGRQTCEPFRVYNTQPNGIYGWNPMSNSQWQSFSNWCPGDVIDTRFISLGALDAGNHVFQISVPTAVFPAAEGNIPVSLYLHGRTNGNVLSSNELSEPLIDFIIYPNPASEYLRIQTDNNVQFCNVIDVYGKQIMRTKDQQELNISELPAGVYFVEIKLSDTEYPLKKKFIKQ